jgi:hypothetical protein
MNAPDPTGEVVQRSTIGWTARSIRAISTAQQIAEESKASVANRAVQLYAWMAEVAAGGGDVYVRLPGENEPRLVQMFPGVEKTEPHGQEAA